MVTCPKCGFVQPPDQFCANCGIDMEKYRAHTAVPLWKRIAGSYFFQASMIVLIVLLTSYGIYQKKQRDIEHLTELAETTQVPAPQPEVAPKPNPPPKPFARLGTAKVREIKIANTPAAVPVVEKKPAETETAPAASPTLKVSFAEISMPFMERLNSDARPLGGVGMISVSGIANLDKLLADAHDSQDIIMLKEEEPRSITIGQKIVISEDAMDPVLQKPVGVQLYLNPIQIDRNGLHLELDFTRSIREMQNDLPSRAVQPDHESGVIHNHGGIFILGALPHRKLMPGEEDAFSGSILRVMSSADFQAHNSEFAIFILGEGLPVAH